MFASAIFAGLPANSAPPTGIAYTGADTIQLVENRANEITIPSVTDEAIQTRLMEWDNALNRFVVSAQATRISEFCKQLSKRYTGSATLTPAVVTRVETVDGDTGNRFVFTPGATPIGSLQDFEVIIPDQLGGYESRGFLLFLANNANPGLIDGGEVRLRILPSALPW